MDLQPPFNNAFDQAAGEFERHMEAQNARQAAAHKAKLDAAIARRRTEAGLPPAAANPAAQPKSLSPELDLRDRYLKEYPDTCYGQGEFRRCLFGLWHPLPLTDLRAEVLRVAEQARQDALRPSARLVSRVIELLRLSTATFDSDWEHEPHLLPFYNGRLDTQTMQLMPHKPNHHFTGAVLPYRYDPRATCPVWEGFLASRVPASAEFLREFAGLALTSQTRFESALLRPWLKFHLTLPATVLTSIACKALPPAALYPGVYRWRRVV